MVARNVVRAIFLASLAVACGSSRPGFDNSDDPSNTPVSATKDPNEPTGSMGAPSTPPEQSQECARMDVVVVVDDSGSMQQEQDNLGKNFAKFIQHLDDYTTKSGAKLDWRVAVTTTSRNLHYTVHPPFGPDMPVSESGDDGAFRKGKCGNTKRWIERGDANASTTFSCLANAGTNGASIEMPLYATKLSLVDRVTDGTNAGFHRSDALLALVILTDEDDCSREDNNFTIQNDSCETMQNLGAVSDYKQELDTIAQGEGRWATAVIAGQTDCKSSFGDAKEAKRLKEFVGLAGKNGTFHSICDGDLAPALDAALNTFDAACKALPGIK